MSENVAELSSSTARLLFGLLFSFCFCYIDLTLADGNVGCLFAESVCLENVEWCFDDYTFGKCLAKNGIESEELERQPLDQEQSHILTTLLEELQGIGLNWHHLYFQCKIQGALFSLRNKVPMPRHLCSHLAPDPQSIDPQNPLAFVQFRPPDNEYADELYYPPAKKGFDDRFYMRPLKTIQPSQPLTSSEHQNINQYQPSVLADLLAANENEPRYYHGSAITKELETRIKDIKNRIELRRMLAQYEAGKLKPPIYYSNKVMEPDYEEVEDQENNLENYLKEEYKRTAHNFKNKPIIYDYNDNIEEEPVQQEEEEEEEPEDEDNTPKTSFREISREFNIPTVNLNHHHQNHHHYPEETNDIPVEPVKFKGFLHHNIESNDVPHESGVYTEGGLVYVPENNQKAQDAYDRKLEARTLLANMLGFTRHERLDVKKPGPPAEPPPSSQSPHEPPNINGTKEKKDTSQQQDGTKEILPESFRDVAYPKMKKVMHADDDHAPYSVDTDFTHVILKTPIENWKDGPRIVTALADMLNMQGFFTFSRVDRHEISFRVADNPEKKTASDVARAINDSRFKNNLSRRLGVVVVRAGVGDKTKEPLSESISKVVAIEEEPSMKVILFACGMATIAAAISLAFCLLKIRRNTNIKEKLGGLQGGLGGAESSSNDYQDLCRARMAGKVSAAEAMASGRITSLSKENDKPPSSRSSTSSWSEEPALTNMDISTGHIVLTYMEDHLKNKGRLQREWEALCRYEAEPGSHEAAIQPQCESLNRSTAPLPYDHSRVVINHLANAEGIDYINASTISDHDPRTPAYIAAQGPLPSTLAHFWQMIWEQGAVVIVALCRLQENGDIACARYWPEEGAEVYHIYEVHLVSEHIWCDDYLVRSFYLKNLRTSETRTVTQFHFLSWPQDGIPAAAKALLDFRRKVNKSYRGRSCPIVVHSSNGAGRTGAYILLDLVLARMNKGAKEIDIAATLEHLRDQRSGLVATKQQFEYVLTAVAEEVHAILKALPTNTQPDKRELDTEAVKEQDSEKDPNGKATSKKDSQEK